MTKIDEIKIVKTAQGWSVLCLSKGKQVNAYLASHEAFVIGTVRKQMERFEAKR